MSDTALLTIPARRGRAQRLTAGQSIRIVNTHGHQVVDFWCFSAEDMGEFLSMEHLRPTLGHAVPQARSGDDDEPPPADPGVRGGHLARHPRHADGGLRRLSLRAARLHRVSRQLHRQPPCGAAPDRALEPGDAVAVQSLDEHPRRRRRGADLRGAGVQARGLRHLPRRDGLCVRHVVLPAGHPADQQGQHGRVSLRGAGRQSRPQARPANLLEAKGCGSPSPLSRCCSGRLRWSLRRATSCPRSMW